MTEVILELLAHMPETQRNIFVWNHYRGYGSRQIAESLGCSLSEVETTLGMINSILYQRAHALVA
jgi:DNA-directed RNA polymerase specialized sigma24 family protein